jgi:hypothetical protein
MRQGGVRDIGPVDKICAGLVVHGGWSRKRK